MKFPDWRFWGSYPGMAVVGLGGFVIGVSVATAMLAFRPQIEPLMPYVFPVATGLMGGRSSIVFDYHASYYPWIVGFFYFMSVFWLAAVAYGAYRKPERDRRIDAYLRRKYEQEGRWSGPP